MPGPNNLIETIRLTTETTQLGDDCVNRQPSRLLKRHGEVDIVRMQNGNNNNSGQSITVTMDPAKAAAVFSPVPAASKTLAPGESVDWVVKDGLVGTVGVKYGTSPDTCASHDTEDIVIAC